MKVLIFISTNCPRCPPAKELGEELKNGGIVVEYCDVGVIDGLTEAAFYGVMSTPSIIITKDNGEAVNAWYGVVPMVEDILSITNGDKV